MDNQKPAGQDEHLVEGDIRKKGPEKKKKKKKNHRNGKKSKNIISTKPGG